MGAQTRLNVMRAGLLASLAGGWLSWFGVYGSSAAGSGSLADEPLEAIVLALVLSAWVGAVAWIAAPRHRRVRVGALAGLLMSAALLIGYVMIAVLWVDPARWPWGGGAAFELSGLDLGFAGVSFWVGLALDVASSVALGALGWALAGAVGRPRRAIAA